MTTPHTAPEPLSAADRATARDVLSRLRAGGDLVVAGSGGPVALPDFIARNVVTLLEAYADGRTLVMAAADEEVSAPGSS